MAENDTPHFRRTPFGEMTPAQRAYADALMSGPVSATGSASVVPGAESLGSPFNVYVRSPELAQQLRKVAEHIRFNSSLPARPDEFAILVTNDRKFNPASFRASVRWQRFATHLAPPSNAPVEYCACARPIAMPVHAEQARSDIR